MLTAGKTITMRHLTDLLPERINNKKVTRNDKHYYCSAWFVNSGNMNQIQNRKSD